MRLGSFILNVCFLIVLVSTSPILQEVNVQILPGTYCDQSVPGNSLIGSLNGEQISDKTLNNIALIHPNQVSDISMKLLYDKIISNPKLVEIINGFGVRNNADISNQDLIQSPMKTPSVVNNYIIIPPDISNAQYSDCMLVNPNICTRVKKNAEKNQDDLRDNTNHKQTNEDVTKGVDNELFINNNQNKSSNQTTRSEKNNASKGTKRLPQAKSKQTQRRNGNKDSNDLSVIENRYKIENQTKKSNIKSNNKNTPLEAKAKKSESINNSRNLNHSDIELAKTVKNQENNKTIKPTTTRKKIKGITLQQSDLINGKQTKLLPNDGQKKKTNEIQSNKENRRKKQKASDSSRSRNSFNSIPINQDYQFPNMPYDSNSMYKYINSIMSNYQFGNNDYKQDFPFNFNNFYQFPHLSNSRSSKKPSRSKSYKRRRHPKFYRRRHNRRRGNSRRRPVDKKITGESVDEINPGSKNTDIKISSQPLHVKEIPDTAIQKDNETVVLIENVLDQKNNISSDEDDKENVINIFDELSFINNSLPEETFNSYPSFIVGLDDKIPIIFENSLIDDYYPDFTADEALQLTTEEANPEKYHNDKYNYVSNRNKFDFGDFIKKRKRIAMKNMSKNSNLFFSGNERNQNVTSDQVEKSNVQIKSPHFLDNPDFRTRKINSNEMYEPYHHHNIYQDPEEDYNKYNIDDTSLVYSTPMSAKNDAKTKSSNDIEDGLVKLKKSMDSNVETVYARSKLAKYGLAL